MKRFGYLIAGLATALLLVTGSADASVSLSLGDDGLMTERVLQLIALLTILSLAPSIVIMTTSFVRIVVVLSLLRTASWPRCSPNPMRKASGRSSIRKWK